jgi:hypothetical protein
VTGPLDAFTPVNMTMLFCLITPCRFIFRYQRFEETFCLSLQGWSDFSPEDGAVCFSEMLVSICEFTRSHDPEKTSSSDWKFVWDETTLLKSWAKALTHTHARTHTILQIADDSMSRGWDYRLWTAATNGPIAYPLGDIWAWRTMVEWRYW